jgi:hypothetical protein
MRNPNGWPRALGVAAAVLFVLAAGCGEESETYEPASWRVGATFAENTTPMAAEAFTDGACYVAGIEQWNELEEMRAVIYRFERGRLELAFRAPDTHSTFWCMGAAPDSIWAGGYDHLDEGVSLDPYVVRYDGATFTEIPCPPFGGMKSVRAVAPVSKDAAFVAFGENDTFSVYYYDNGKWRPCLDGLPEMWEISLVATPSGKVFVNCMAEPGKAGTAVVLASQDKGVTWHRETCDGAPGSRAFGRPVLAASGETLYLAATFIQEKPAQNVLYIFRRDAAPPGEGVYVADFREADTDTIPEVGALTVADGNGYAVGRGTGYRRREGGWTRQDFSAMPSSGMWDVTGGGGNTDFWAIGQYFNGDDYCRLFVSP